MDVKLPALLRNYEKQTIRPLSRPTPTDQPTDVQTGSKGSYTFKKDKIIMKIAYL